MRKVIIILVILSASAILFKGEIKSIYSNVERGIPINKAVMFSATNDLKYIMPPEQYEEMIKFQKEKEKKDAVWKTSSQIRKKYDISYSVRDGMDEVLPLPIWMKEQKEKALELLRKSGPYDVLVVPVQATNISNTDSRHYMSYRLAQLVSENGHKVVPISHVRTILGVPMEMYQDSDVYELADMLDVKEIYWSYGGKVIGSKFIERKPIHFEKRMYYLARQIKGGTLIWKGSNFESSLIKCENESYDKDESILLISHFESCISKVHKDFALKPISISKVESDHDFTLNQYLSVTSKEKFKTSLVHEANYLQLIASLLPGYTGNLKDELLLKSLMILNKIDPSSEDYKFLKARAYFEFGYRPLAVNILGESKTPSELALRELMNGNLPELYESLNEIKDDYHYLFMSLSYLKLEHDYKDGYLDDTGKKLIENLMSRYSYLSYEINRKLEDNSLWDRHSNMYLKALLDAVYPVKGISLDDLVSAAQVSGDFSTFEDGLETLFLKYIALIAHEQNFPEKVNALASELDYLYYLQAVGISNIVRSIHFQSSVQGKPERAQLLYYKYEKHIADHPLMLWVKQEYLKKLSEKSSGDEREKLLDQLKLSYKMYEYFYRDERSDLQSAAMENPLLWSHNNLGGVIRNINFKISNNEAIDDSVLSDIEGRFKGNSQKIDLELTLSRNDEVKTFSIYERAIRELPENWKYFDYYSKMLALRGQLDKLDSIFTLYKPFSVESDVVSRVSLSHQAYDAGNIFYWNGVSDLAKKYFSISSNLNTGSGSGSSEKSAAKIALLNKEYSNSISFYLKNARHYNDSFSYKSGVSLMAFLGKPNDAMDFMKSRFLTTDSVYNSFAMIDIYRMSNVEEKDVCDWLSSLSRIRKDLVIKGYLHQFSYQYMIAGRNLNNFSDSNNIFSCIQIDVDVRKKFLNEQLDRIGSGNSYAMNFEPADYIEFFKNLFDTEYFLANGDADSANKSFYLAKKSCGNDPARMMGDPIWDCTLAFYENMIKWKKNTLEKPEDKYDYLRHAFYDAKSGYFEGSVASLSKEWNSRVLYQSKNYYSLLGYDVIRSAEWFYQETKSKIFIDFILEKARVYQMIEPWSAFGYSYVAKYSANPDEKKIALAYTMYLDRNSSLISGFSEKEKKEAQTWFDKNIKPRLIAQKDRVPSIEI